MALTILYTVTRSADFKQISVADNNTQWGVSGEMNTGDVTGISLALYGTDKNTPLKTITFTSQERTTFLAGNEVTLLFSDSRLFGTTIAPDNFYTSQMDVTGGSTISTQVCFDSYFYIKKIVMGHIADVSVPILSYYEANKAIVGDLASITTLDYLSSVISASREAKWRQIYDSLAWNYNL